MSEEFNNFEDEKTQEIDWNQIIQDFTETKMPIDTFCKTKGMTTDKIAIHNTAYNIASVYQT